MGVILLWTNRIIPFHQRVDGSRQETRFPYGTDLGTPQIGFLGTLVEIDALPIRQVPRRSQILERIVDKDIEVVLRKHVRLGLGLQGTVPGVSGTRHRDGVPDRQSHLGCPDPWRIRKQLDVPALARQFVDLRRLVLKISRINNVRQVVQQGLIIDVLIEIAHVHIEHALKTARRVSVREIQNVVGRIRVFGRGEFLANVRDAIVLDMFHQGFATQNNAINVEEE